MGSRSTENFAGISNNEGFWVKLSFIYATAHNELAKRLIQQYPKLVNDIHVSEAYYGE